MITREIGEGGVPCHRVQAGRRGGAKPSPGVARDTPPTLISRVITRPKIRHTSEHKELDKGLIVEHSFSSKPPGGYKEYYDKLTTYAAILSSPAQAIDPMTRRWLTREIRRGRCPPTRSRQMPRSQAAASKA